MNRLLCIFALLFVQITAWPAKYNLDDYADFTKPPGEYSIKEVKEPIAVGSVKGTVKLWHNPKEPMDPLANVLVEIEGNDKKIRSCKTDGKGRFSISHVPSGTYKFKATLDGFQSVIGVIIVARGTTKKDEIQLVMNLEI
jgi:hypothetical protein